jgi:hypothetical protein
MVLWVSNLSKEKKPCFYVDIYGFLVFPLKILDTSLWNRILDNLRDCSFGHINSNSIGLSYRLVHIIAFRVFSILVLK